MVDSNGMFLNPYELTPTNNNKSSTRAWFWWKRNREKLQEIRKLQSGNNHMFQVDVRSFFIALKINLDTLRLLFKLIYELFHGLGE